jgi:hypothetical protein
MKKVLPIVLAASILQVGISTSARPILLSQSQLQSAQVSFLNGIWEGSYICPQGLTRLKLVINAKSTTSIDAVFMFSAHPSNPGVPSGRFRMEGTLGVFDSPEMPDLLDLKGTAWINQPSGWFMVDLKGDVSSSKRKITGNIPQPGCSTFEVVKRDF